MASSGLRARTQPESTGPIELTIRPRTVARFCAAGIALTVAAHVLSQVARFGFGRAYLMGLAGKVYLGAEASIPNWFSTLLLLACGVALLAIGAAADKHTAHWRGLGIIFVGLSLDESAALHDLVAPFFTGVIAWLARTAGGPFVGLEQKPGYAWLVPGAVAAAAVAVAYLPFLAALPRWTRAWFLLSGGVYVAGAVGFEVLDGWYSGLYGSKNVTFVTLLTVEETLEMIGASLFLFTLLAFAEEQFGEIRIHLKPHSSVDSQVSGSRR
jgi:hypothetical protein